MIGLSYIANIKDISLSDIGKEMGIKRQTVCDWCNGRSKIPLKRLEQLVTMFNLPQEYFTKELSYQDMIKILELEIEKLQKTKLN